MLFLSKPLSDNKFHARDLLYGICAFVSLIVDVVVGVAFVLSAFIGGALVDFASTCGGTSGGTVLIASVSVVFFFLLSLAAVRLLGIIEIVVDLKREEEEGKRSRCCH